MTLKYYTYTFISPKYSPFSYEQGHEIFIMNEEHSTKCAAEE